MGSEDALSMGYLTEVVAFSDIEKAVMDASDGTTEPYGYPYSPRLGESEKIGNILSSYTLESMESMISGSFDMSNHFLSRQAKLISRNAPIAIQMAADLIEIANESREDRGIGLQAELDGLDAIFSTNDALKGLKSVLEGSRVSFDGA
jgi:enoyl-CoA hydratase/carnithine racemase